MHDLIKLRGVRVNNLKNVNLDIPKHKLVVVTGLSGSGKSSLAFDTIYAEGQRRYAESLSSYAKQFLDLMDKPDVDSMEGLSPTIAIDQKTGSVNPRSTLGTVTEIYDYLRLLYAKIGVVHCHQCQRVVEKQTPEQILITLAKLPLGTRVSIFAPIIVDKRGQHSKQLNAIAKTNYESVRIDGQIYNTRAAVELSLDVDKLHTIEVLIDQPLITEAVQTQQFNDPDHQRLAKAIGLALDLGNGFVHVNYHETEELRFNLYYLCQHCGISIPDIEPRLFSFNSPFGACPACRGLGIKLVPDPALIIPNTRLTIAEGAIKPWSRNFASQTSNMKLLAQVAEKHNFSLSESVDSLSDDARKIIFQGTGAEKYNVEGEEMTFDGLIAFLDDKYLDTKSEYLQKTLEEYMRISTCPTCHGTRLRVESLAVTINDQSIDQISNLDIEQSLDWCQALVKQWSEKVREGKIIRPIVKEITKKLGYLQAVGLHYLTLSRSAMTLSGGESQRVRLATQIGSGLESVIYILDEPSIGLHARDTEKLIKTLQELRDKGNSVIVVEHDEQMISAADHLIDVGPGAGALGGEIVSQGTVAQIKKDKHSITGQYLSGKQKIEVPHQPRKGSGKMIEIVGADEFNLQNINVAIPLGKMVAITGVSGSGKSTLVNDILARALSQRFYRSKDVPGKHTEIKGLENLDKVINIDQSPIGRTPRSNPATYTGVFTYVRDLYANLPESKLRGFKQGHFSFNVKGGGRCEACSGDGMVKIEMQFLPDVYVECESCHGKRYQSQALEIHYHDKNIADVLALSVAEARKFFTGHQQIVDKLAILEEVGLGYVKLGQSATTLSGGEAQRIKLATELSRRPTGKTLYILDEPTTGLHFADIQRLLIVLNRLADKDNSVIIIEHNLEVIKSSDWVIDLGPDGGSGGGQVVAVGTPADVAKVKGSYTGQYLKKIM